MLLYKFLYHLVTKYEKHKYGKNIIEYRFVLSPE